MPAADLAGVVKVWDTSSEAVVAEFDCNSILPSGSSKTSVSFMQWASVDEAIIDSSFQGKSVKKTKKTAAPKLKEALIVGLANGTVLIASPDAPASALVLKDAAGHGGAISSVVMDAAGARAFTASFADKFVLQWDLSNRSIVAKHSPPAARSVECMAAVGENARNLLVGHHTISFIEDAPTAFRATSSFPGHPSRIAKIACGFRDAADVFVSFAEDDRFFTLWSVSQAAQVFSAGVSCNIADAFVFSCEKGTKKIVVAVLDVSGTLSLFDASSASPDAFCVISFKNSLSPIDNKRREHDKILVLAAALVRGTDALCVCRGSLLMPRFERISLADSTHSQPLQGDVVFERADAAAALPAPSSSTLAAPCSVGNDAADVKEVSFSSVSKRAPVVGVSDEAMSNVSRDVHAQDDSFESRLHKLSILDAADATDASVDGKRAAVKHSASVYQLILQGIASKDNSLLEEALRTTDSKAIARTVQRLPFDCVQPFVRWLIVAIQRTPNKATLCLPWIRATLVLHMASLASRPSMRSMLVALHQTLKSRISFAAQLHDVCGRLDLLAEKIAFRSTVRSAADDDYNTPLLVIEGDEMHKSIDDDDDNDAAASFFDNGAEDSDADDAGFLSPPNDGFDDDEDGDSDDQTASEDEDASDYHEADDFGSPSASADSD